MVKDEPSPAASLLAGAFAGAVEAAVTYPFEFAKTRVQLQGQGIAINPFLVTRQVLAEGGLGAIYTGCGSLVIGCAAKAGVRFLTFDTIKNALADEQGRLSVGRGIFAGLAAGVVESVVAVTPTERVKTALIDDAKGQKRFRGGLDAVRILVRERGLSEVYRGLVSTTLKQAGTSAVRMGSYNAIKQSFRSWDIQQNAGTTFVQGAMAGTITVYATQPLDTVKTRAQSAAGASTKDAFVSIFRDLGVRGFWKGSTMRLGRLVLSGGIIFSVYEQTVALLNTSTI